MARRTAINQSLVTGSSSIDLRVITRANCLTKLLRNLKGWGCTAGLSGGREVSARTLGSFNGRQSCPSRLSTP